MKKKIVSSLFIFLVVSVFFAGIVLAENIGEGNEPLNSSNGEKHEVKSQKFTGIRPQLKESTTEFKDNLQDDNDLQRKKFDDESLHKASRSADLRQKATEELKRNFGKLDIHLLAYLERLDKIAEKINSRIAKLKGNGVDTTRVEAKMNDAKVLRDAAKTAIDKAKADIDAVDASTATKESVMGSRQSVEAAKKALVAYHKGLSDAVRVLASISGSKEASGSAREGTRGSR